MMLCITLVLMKSIRDWMKDKLSHFFIQSSNQRTIQPKGHDCRVFRTQTIVFAHYINLPKTSYHIYFWTDLFYLFDHAEYFLTSGVTVKIFECLNAT